MNKRKLVGVMPLWDDAKASIWMLPGYLEGLRMAGVDCVLFPLTEDSVTLERLTNLCDGILLTGGHDVNPAVYGEAPLNETVVWNNTRDAMDKLVIQLALQQDKPILGICRGMQILNAALGGTLYQDLPVQRPTGIAHHMQKPYDQGCHRVTVQPNTPLYELLETTQLSVNSIHHQAVKTLSPMLREMARSEDGLVEAVYMPDRQFVWGVQWHPEYWFATNDACRRIFQGFTANL